MSINILMPALSPTMTEGKLAKWHVKVGDTVKSGQVICEIETDKATMEVEAVDEGKIGQIVVPEGAEGVTVNAVIAILLEEGETAVPAGAAPAPPAPAPKPAPAAAPPPASKPAPPRLRPRHRPHLPRKRPPRSRQRRRAAAASSPRRSPSASPRRRGSIFRASRAAGRTAASSRPTSSPPSRVRRRPPLPSQRPRPGPHRRPAGSRSSWRRATRACRTPPIRKVIARRMLESKQTVPHFYLTVDLEIDALLAARQAINAVAEKKGTKVSVNDMVIKACAKALRDHPECNASWTEDEMIQYGAVDISVAVATDRGLITPIVRNADMKGLAQIASEMKDLAARAKAGKLKLDEFQGGGFTISNLGMFGINELLRHHQSAAGDDPGGRHGRGAGGRAQRPGGRAQHDELHPGGRSPGGRRRDGRAIPADAARLYRAAGLDAGLVECNGRYAHTVIERSEGLSCGIKGPSLRSG